MLDVAVHIVTYNHATCLALCLDALQAANTYPKFETWVIDNASLDSSVSIARQYDVHIAVNSKNIGYAAAHNQAILLSNSRYILTLNPDVAISPDFIFHLWQALESDSKLGSAAGCLYRVESLESAPLKIDGCGLFLRRNRRQGLRGENYPIDQKPIQSALIFAPDGAAAFYRRQMLTDIALDGEIFDEDFFLHKEDIDLGWRAQWRGWSSIYIPEATAKHIRHFRAGWRNRHQIDPKIRAYAVRNRYLLMLKNDHLLSWWDCLAVGFYELQIWSYLLLFERSSLWAIGSFLKLRRRMLYKRHIIQEKRKVDQIRFENWMPSKQR